MKIISVLAAIFCVTLLFIGCQKEHPNETPLELWLQDNGRIKVLSTTAMIEDIVSQIGGEYIDTLTLITGQLDPHSYQLVKGDDEKLKAAQLIFYNGLGLEHGPSLQTFLKKNEKAISLGSAIQNESPEAIITVDGQMDPHIWMDISLWIKTIDPVVTSLSVQDPHHAEIYRLNALALKHEMELANDKIYQQLQSIPEEKRYLVTSHDAFNYFAKAYLATQEERADGSWKKRVAAPEGLAPEGQLSAKDIQGIISYLKEHHMEVLFPESNVSKDSIKKIVNAGREVGLDLKMSRMPLYADAMGPQGSQADGYLKMLEYDTHVVTDHLNPLDVHP